MKIIIDTREQRPLEFKHRFITGCIFRKIDAGDYAVEFEDGYSPPVVFERKSISDLFGTLGDGYKRFKKEIVRAREANVTIIIIVEQTLFDIKEGIERSFRSGDTILSQLFTLRARYGIETVFCNGRDECSEYITQFYLGLGREYIKNKGTQCSLTADIKTQESSQGLST